MKNIFLILSILIIIFNQTSFANQNKYDQFKYCYELDYNKSLDLNPNKFKTFEITVIINDQRKWNKILLQEEIKKKKTNAGKNYFYKNRDRVKALLLIKANNIECKLSAKIRPHGDLYDHRIGSGLTSLNVNLQKGHIFGIVEFILFRPKTRGYENEVFATTLFREVGLLAPRSANIIVKYGDISSNFIFQEKINKEFLENQNLVEGPILEGDERFLGENFYAELNLFKHRISNYKWAKKNKTNLSISEYSLSLLNKIDTFHSLKSNLIELTEIDVVDYYHASKKINYIDYFKDLATFDAFMFSIEASHGLSRDDRRFYFDPIYKKFYPIYYDGMVKALSYYNNIILIENLNNINQNIDKLSLTDGKIIPSAIDGSKEASNMLKKIDLRKFYSNLKKNGSALTYKNTETLLKKIERRINLLQDLSPKRVLDIKFNKKINNKMQEDIVSNKLKKRLVYYDDDFDQLLNCNLREDQCVIFSPNIKIKAQLLGQRLKDDNSEYIFVSKKKKFIFIKRLVSRKFY